MGVEIERKFLVRDPSILSGAAGTLYQQGYLSIDPERTVRVRRAGGHAYLTIKGRSRGATRAEFEYEIPTADAVELLVLCAGSLISKTRYRIPVGDQTWEVDVFAGDNAGLVVAEVEIPSADTPVEIPAWVGEEVTSDPRYYNANLVDRPFRTWETPRRSAESAGPRRAHRSRACRRAGIDGSRHDEHYPLAGQPGDRGCR